MKKMMVFSAFVLVVFNGMSQDPDPRIFSTWYILEYIEEGVSYFPPDNYPIEIFSEGDQGCDYKFHLPNPWRGGKDCLESLTDTQFVVQSLGILAKGEICQDEPPPCEIFFSSYYPLYSNAEITGDPLSYEIEDLPTNKRTLIVTNLNGDQAIYSNQYLSINDNSRVNAVVYPNPVYDELVVMSSIPIKKVRVFNIHGVLILETSSKKINFSVMQNGVYFVEVANFQGKEIHKIIKK